MFKQKKIITIILLLTGIFLLTACIEDENGGGNGENPPPIEELIDNSFFDLSYMNYNNNYSNPDDLEEKGFILYDTINFNLIDFQTSHKRSPRFEIFFNEELLQSIEMSPNGTVFPSYTFSKTGEYKIKVLAYPSAQGSTVQGEFLAKVRAGGYPDKIVTQTLDLDGNVVAELIAGQQYKLSAQVYSDEQLLAQDSPMFSSQWLQGEQGNREVIITVPNQKEDTILPYAFYYTCYVNNYTTSEQHITSMPVKNNYAGIELDYGSFLTEKDVTLSVTEFASSQNKEWLDAQTNFIQFVQANHCYDNGDKEEIKINYKDIDHKLDTVAAFIRYDNDKDFVKYRKGLYNFKSINNNYIQNNAVYQLDPRKNTAELYFAYCEKEEFQGGWRPFYKEIKDSKFNITLEKYVPDSISVVSISGSQKSGKDQNGKITFENFNNREVINNKVEVKVQVTEGVYPITENQYFSLNIKMDETAEAKDYVVEIGNRDYLEYVVSQNIFRAKKEGESTIKIKSFAGSAEYVLTVTTVNPLEKYQLIQKSKRPSEEIPNVFIGKFDYRPYLQVQESYYNNTIVTRTQLKENEVIRYFDSKDNEVKEDTLLCSPNQYKNISIKLCDTGNPCQVTDAIIVSFYVIPDFKIEVDEQTFIMSEVSTTKYYKTKGQLIGYLPVLTVEVSTTNYAPPEVIGNVSNIEIEEGRCYFNKYNNAFDKYELCYMINNETGVITIMEIDIKK